MAGKVMSLLQLDDRSDLNAYIKHCFNKERWTNYFLYHILSSGVPFEWILNAMQYEILSMTYVYALTFDTKKWMVVVNSINSIFVFKHVSICFMWCSLCVLNVCLLIATLPPPTTTSTTTSTTSTVAPSTTPGNNTLKGSSILEN